MGKRNGYRRRKIANAVEPVMQGLKFTTQDEGDQKERNVLMGLSRFPIREEKVLKEQKGIAP